MQQKDFSFRHFIHEKISRRLKDVDEWFLEKAKGRRFPFYSSFDIRDSNSKAACVDANLFPAGFNNICEEDQKRTELLIKDYIKKNYSSVKTIILLAEEHTKNLYYWDNIFVIKSLIEQAGCSVSICAPGKNISLPLKIQTAGGRNISIQPLNAAKGDLIISNNDFSDSYQLPSEIQCIPPVSMGWLERKKHHFFKEYNLLAEEFAHFLKIDSWHLKVETKLFSPFDVESKENLSKLKTESALMLEALKEKQPESFKEKPYLFLKNNSGTYGMGVMSLSDPESLSRFNWKSRKKMKSAKGEGKVSEIIIQEGIPTALHSPENQSAEPVIYMIGGQAAGAFLRSHKTKDHKTNLNSPGAVFRRLCINDLEIKMRGLVMENVYSRLAKIGALALSREMEKSEALSRGQ